jgi:tetratricopeptide (TPR) repeat protein
LRSGQWTFTAQAPGFAPSSGKAQIQTIGGPNPPINFTLAKGAPAGAPGALAGVNSKELQAELAAADQLYNSGQYDQAIAAYQAVLAKTPVLTALNLQIAQAYRMKASDAQKANNKDEAQKSYDSAIAAYEQMLKADPKSDKAKIGIGMTNLEKGDLDAAEKTLDEAALTPGATKEVFYNLGEVKFAKAKNEDAIKAYERAAQMDPNWGKPVFALGKVSLNKGDKDGAIKYFEQVVTVDPMSPEAAQAKAIVEQLKK